MDDRKYMKKDLTGWRFGRWVVMGPAYRETGLGWFWRCRCDCGSEKVLRGRNLSDEISRSCGCLARDTISGPRTDLTGRVYGRLTVLAPARSGLGGWWWKCRCVCGNIKAIRGSNLNVGYTRSCGCLHKDQLGDRRRTHGFSYDPVYAVWVAMIQRCSNSDNAGYAAYGGRGIKVCARWQGENGLSAFMSDMGTRPEGGFSVERTDVDGDYTPGNCVWATRETQNNNKRTSVRIEYDGRTQTLAQWCRELKVRRQRVEYRLGLGMTFAEAVDYLRANPPSRTEQVYDFNGEKWTARSLTSVAGVPAHVISRRLAKGWALARAVTEPAREGRPAETVEYRGRTWVLRDLAREHGVRIQTLRHRLDDMGWGLEEALTAASEKDPTRHTYTLDGVTRTLKELVTGSGLSYQAVKYRLDHGWDVKSAVTTPAGHRQAGI